MSGVVNVGGGECRGGECRTIVEDLGGGGGGGNHHSGGADQGLGIGFEPTLSP